MHKDKISWSIPILAVIAILIGVYFLSCFLGIETLSFIGISRNFISGAVIGYVVWLLMD